MEYKFLFTLSGGFKIKVSFHLLQFYVIILRQFVLSNSSVQNVH